MTIGERIKQRRNELRLTQEELAKRLGNKSRASVCTVEKDKEDLTTDRIVKYAKALECSPAYLMGWASDAKSTEADPIEIKVPRPKTLSIVDPDEIELIEAYRSQIPAIRNAARRVLGLKEDGGSGLEERGAV